MTMDTDRHTNDLTQLSSREQLSALMDGALSEDQTRFLLRRLQHDTELAGCWERWRIAGDAMRGTVSASPLAEGFSARVVAAIQGEPLPVTPSKPRWPAWIHWSGGAAVAATVAAIAFMLQPTPSVSPDVAPRVSTVTVSTAPVSAAPLVAAAAEKTIETSIEKPTEKPVVVAQTSARQHTTPNVAMQPPEQRPVQVIQEVPEISEIPVRPWPRSILPQYGHSEMATGFSESFLQSGNGNPFATAPFSSAPKLSTQTQAQTHQPHDSVSDTQSQAANPNKEGP